MNRCFWNSFIIVLLFLGFLFLFDLVWLLLPQLPSFIEWVVYVVILFVSFRLATRMNEVMNRYFFKQKSNCTWQPKK